MSQLVTYQWNLYRNLYRRMLNQGGSGDALLNQIKKALNRHPSAFDFNLRSQTLKLFLIFPIERQFWFKIKSTFQVNNTKNSCSDRLTLTKLQDQRKKAILVSLPIPRATSLFFVLLTLLFSLVFVFTVVITYLTIDNSRCDYWPAYI